MGSNPAIEKVVSNTLRVINESKLERVSAIDIPHEFDQEDIEDTNLCPETQCYRIEPAAYGLFTFVVKRYNKTKLHSIELISPPVDSCNMAQIEQLSNQLYEILKDHTVGGLGRFNKSDAYLLTERKIWPGKIWVDYKTGSLVTLSTFYGITRLNIINGNGSDGA